MKVALFLTQLEPALGHVAGFDAFCSDQPLPGQQDLTPQGVAPHLRVEAPGSWSLSVLRDTKGTMSGASWEVRAHPSFSKLLQVLYQQHDLTMSYTFTYLSVVEVSPTFFTRKKP